MTYRVAMVAACPYPVPQGSQVLLKDTAAIMRERGHEVHLVVYGYGIGDAPPDRFVHRGRNLPGARRTAAGPSLAKPFQDLALATTLRRLVSEHHIDIVHAHNYEGLLVALAAGARPIVYHAHNAMADELPHFVRGGSTIGAWLDRALPRRADHIIAPHKRLADYLARNGCRSDRISVVPPGIAWPTDAQPAAVSDTLPPVVYPGNLDPYQNLPFLLEAMAMVRQAEAAARLLVATGSATALPGAEMVPVDGPEALARVLAMDCIVACPRTSWSGYPIKLLNAMAAARPIVACESAAPGLTRDHDCLIVSDDDVGGFADALLRLLRDADLRRLLGAQAKATFEKAHNPNVVGSAIEECYDRAMTQKRRR